MFAKIDVNGDGAAPLYRLLTQQAPNKDGSTDVKWNFTKFLVDREGKPIRRFQPPTTPEVVAAKLPDYL